MSIIPRKSPVYLRNGVPQGEPVFQKKSLLKDLSGYFCDEDAYGSMNPDTLLYCVDAWMPVEEGVDGGLFFGLSTIVPGRVGREFFMTKGHFHDKESAAEFYWGIEGRGILLLMDKDGSCEAEIVEVGSLHYIRGHRAHRLVNTGTVPLKVGACWPSDAGHNYGDIARTGFSIRVFYDEHKGVVLE